MKRGKKEEKAVKNAPKKKAKWLLIIILAVIVLSIAAYFLFFSNKLFKEVSMQEKYSLGNNITKYEEKTLELFECLNKEKFITCPETNSENFEGSCVKIDECRDDFLVEIKNITVSERIFNNTKVESAWNNCYFNNLSSIRVNSSYLSGYVKEEFDNCWKGILTAS